MTSVGFVGMTHLGLVSATALASKGLSVLCFDQNSTLIDKLDNGELPVREPGLDDMLAANGDRQRFSSSFHDLSQCDVVYIAPDVPTDDAGQSDLTDIRSLVADVLPSLDKAAVLVILCQVPPGFTRAIDWPSDQLYYQVETLVFGNAVERAASPERYIIGCAEPANALHASFDIVLKTGQCPLLPMRYESAELAKISINMCLVASVCVANTMAELSEQIGANWHEIVPALKLDRRIGQYSYLAPGLGIAGGNLERDLATVIRLAGEEGTDHGVVSAWLANSRRARDWALRTFQKAVLANQQDPMVAVWGLAYKENTHSVKNSPSLATISQLPETRFRLHDPVVPASAANHSRSEAAPDPLSATAGADALMILTPWPLYREFTSQQIADSLAGRIVIDPYRVLDPIAAEAAGLECHTLGMPSRLK